MMDWDALRRAYITSRKSYRQLAEETGVSYTALRRQGQQENWPGQRRERETATGCDRLVRAQRLLEEHILRLLREETVGPREVTELGRAIKTALENKNVLDEKVREAQRLSVHFDHPEWAE